MGAERGATYLPGGFPIGSTLIGVGPVADRPAANSDLTPRLWYDPDTDVLYIDEGGSWHTAAVADHGGLGGLADDDHTQYLRADGTRKVTLATLSISQGLIIFLSDTGIFDDMRLTGNALGFGPGNAPLDKFIRRLNTGVLAVYSAASGGTHAELEVATPTGSNSAATKNYVDTGFQPLDADLTSIAALTTTAFGRSLLEAANAAALRTLADSPSNSEAVLDTLFDANTILKADSDNTPEALTVAEQTVVGRITGGEITALTASEVRTLLDVPTNAQAILDSLIDAKGDLIVGTAADTPARLAVGSDYYALVADSSTSDGLAWLPPILTSCSMGALAMASGWYYASMSPTSTLTLTAGTAVYSPVWFGRACTLDRVAISQTLTGGASSTMRLGLYAPHATTGLPDALVADFGTVTGSGTGLREVTISQAVKAGMYWQCLVAQGTGSPVVRAAASFFHGGMAGDTSSTGFGAGTALLSLTQTSVTGALDATASPNGAIYSATQGNPAFLWRAA